MWTDWTVIYLWYSTTGLQTTLTYANYHKDITNISAYFVRQYVNTMFKTYIENLGTNVDGSPFFRAFGGRFNMVL